MSLDTDLLEEILIYTLNNDLLVYIFKDLIWGIIRYKEENWEDSSERLRGFIEHSHKALYEKLINLTSNPIYLKEYEKSAKKLYDKLRWYIFWDLSIIETTLLEETRQMYEDLASHFHEIISDSSQSEFPLIIATCIKLMLFVEEIIFGLERNQKNKLKSIDIIKKHGSLFTLKNNEIIEAFIHNMFSKKKITDLIFQKSILDLNDISNSRVLQIFLPFYVFNHLRIETLLSETIIYPFRSVGPHLIDFEQGNWLYIPKNARFIKKRLEITKKSILISAMSGTGKTVISRWIGYSFYKNGFTVFYIDCLELKAKKIETVLDQIIILNERNPSNTLFIFENIHILDDDLKNKLIKCKDETLCLLTERIFEEKGEEIGDFRQKFKERQRIEILMNHWSFKKTIKGIINLNSKNNKIINQIRHIGNQNLWIYAIILKLFKEFSDFRQNTSIINILADHQLIGEKISDYFQNLFNKKPIKILSSEEALYLNHTHYFLGILSIFSEYELWTEENFFDYLISINDETPLGLYNLDIKINKDILKKIQACLIDIFEINERIVNIKPGIKQKEFKIPHSQMAIIYRNTILNLIEKSYPGLQNNIFNLYIFYGNYYGQLLNYKYQKSYLANKQQPQQVKIFSFKECQQYTAIESMDLFLSKFFEKIKNRSLREINIFTERCRYSKCIEDNEQDYVNSLLEKLLALGNHYWELKISDANPRSLFYFLESIKDYLGGKYLIRFFERFKTNILRKMSKSSLDLIIKLMFNLFKESENMIYAFHKDFKELIIGNDESYDEFIFSINYIESFEESILTNTHLSMIVEEKLNQYLWKSDLKIDLEILSRYSRRREIFLSIYDSFLEKVVEDRNFTQIFKDKLIKSNLNQLCTFIYTLAEHNPVITSRILVLFFEDIKHIFEKSDVKSIAEILIEIKYIKEIAGEFKNLLFDNWDWFLNLFLKFNAYDIMNHYHSISKHFLGAIDPKSENKFEIFIRSIILDKLREYYSSIDKKFEIYKLLIKNDLLSYIKDEIFSLFTISIKNILENPSSKLDNLIIIFTEFQSNYTAFSIFNTDYEFDIINSNKIFKNLIENAKEKTLFKFMAFLKDKANNWFKKFTEKHRSFLKEKYGNNFEVAHLCSKEGREYLKRIPDLVQDLDIESINIIYNSTYRTWYPITTSFKATDDLIDIHNTFLREIDKQINLQKERFLSDEMVKILATINSTTTFNFIIILYKFHSELLHEIFNNFQQVIIDKLRETLIKPLILFRILETFELSIFNLKEFLNSLFNEEIFLDLLANSLKQIDLFSLRFYISYLFSPYLTRKNRSDEIELIKEKFNFIESIKHSNLLQIALALHQDSISLLKKPAGLVFLKGQKRTRQIRLVPKDFKALTTDMAFFTYDKDREVTHIPLNSIFPYDKETILKTPIFYTDLILEKMKESNLHDISQYLETLLSWIEEINDRLLNPPLEFLRYFNSDSFSNTLKDANSDDVFLFFEVSFKLFPKITQDLWARHHNYFKKEEFTNKIKNNYYKDVYKFYTLNYIDLNQVPLDIIEIIKSHINNLDFEKLIWAFTDLGEKDLEFHLVNFKSNLEDIIQKCSRQEIISALQQYKFFEKSNEKLEMIIKRLPLIETKREEKYFFEQ